MKILVLSFVLLTFALPTMAATQINKPFIGTPTTKAQLLSCEIVKSKYSGKVYEKGNKTILTMAPKWALCSAKPVAKAVTPKPVIVPQKTAFQLQLEEEARNMMLYGSAQGRTGISSNLVTIPEVPQGEMLATEDRARVIANEEITRRQAEALRQAEENARLSAEADRAAAQRAAEEATQRVAEAREAERLRGEVEAERIRPDFIGQVGIIEVAPRNDPAQYSGRTPYMVRILFTLKGVGIYVVRCTNTSQGNAVGYVLQAFDRQISIEAQLSEYAQGLERGSRYDCAINLTNDQSVTRTDFAPTTSRSFTFTVPN